MTDAGDRLSRFLVAHNGPPLTPVKETGMDREHPTALALEREASIT